MKHISITALLLTLLLGSCIKENVSAPDFEVTTEKTTYKVGEPVVFLFKGDARQLSFYSGEPGHNYAYNAGRILKGTGIELSFSSYVKTGTQANQLAVFYSTDFNGLYDSLNLKQATWTDITSRFTLAPGEDETASGVRELSDLLKADKPIYFAFKYTTRPQAVNGKQRNWYVRKFLVQMLTSSGKVDLATQATPGFQLVTMGGKEADRTTLSTSQILFRGNATNTEANTEDWVVTTRLNPYEVNLGADWATAIKGYADFKQDTLTYTYQAEGTFTATFLARNANAYGDQSVIKTVPLIIKKN